MIGTLIFRLGAPALGLALPLVLAAEVQLTGDSKLSGELIAMDQHGTITLVTPFSDTPFKSGQRRLQASISVRRMPIFRMSRVKGFT